MSALLRAIGHEVWQTIVQQAHPEVQGVKLLDGYCLSDATMTLLLVVDDEVLIGHVLVDALEDGGFKTVQTVSAEEAIADSAHLWTAEGVPHSVLVQKPFAVAQVTTAIAQLINEAATRKAMLGLPAASPPGED